MDAFTGEIRAFPFSYAPEKWLLCNGQSLQIQGNTNLYAVIGVRYGGDGKIHFNLPDLQGLVLVGSGTLPGGATYPPGVTGGVTNVVLTGSQMPAHTHTFNGLTTSDSAPTKGVNMPTPTSYLSNIFEVPPPEMKRQGNFFSPSLPAATLNSGSVNPFPGKSGAHDNMQPYLVLNYCICIDGYLPARP